MTTTSEPTGTETRTAVQHYFERLRAHDDWARLLADDVVFISRTSPEREFRGRDAYMQSVKGFYGMVVDFAVRDLIVDGHTACALTRYRLRPPSGTEFESDVAEIFTVKDGAIESLAIYFDTAPYPKRASK
jgi:ketosteroid isomerase-like protein